MVNTFFLLPLWFNEFIFYILVVCVYNLTYIEEPGAGERQAKLREVGAHKILGQLLNTPDANLSEMTKILNVHIYEVCKPIIDKIVNKNTIDSLG